MNESLASNPGSVTQWILGVRQGDPLASEQLVHRYFKRLCRVSLSRLRQGKRIVEDDEDIAIQVLESVFRKVKHGAYPDLQNRNELWFLMIAITQRIVISRQRIRKNKLQANDLEDSREIVPAGQPSFPEVLETYNQDLDSFLGSDEQSDQRLLEILDCWQDLIHRIKDPQAKQVAKLKLEGRSTQEIAAILKVVPRSVERKFKLIEERWNSLYGDDFHF